MLCRSLRRYLLLSKEATGKLRHFIFFGIILEIAHQFPLLGVDADDRQAAFGEPQACCAAMCWNCSSRSGTGAGRDALVIDTQPVAEVLEDAGDGPGTHLDVEGGQFCVRSSRWCGASSGYR